ATAFRRQLVGVAPEVCPQVHASGWRARDLRAHALQGFRGARATLVELDAQWLEHAFVASLDDDARDHAFSELTRRQAGQRLDVAKLTRQRGMRRHETYAEVGCKRFGE